MATSISQKAIDLIVDFEVTGKSYYERNYRKPEWPEGASGITIGIGYDLGYCSKNKIIGDWQGKVDESMLEDMLKYSGITGTRAKAVLSQARKEIDIPWDVAMEVFMERDVPEWTEKVINILPNTDQLSEDSLGALVSLAYNRGPSFNLEGSRYAEMRAIIKHMANEEFDENPDDIRAMKRLWPNVSGLKRRRDAEADLFEEGLAGSEPDTEENQ